VLLGPSLIIRVFDRILTTHHHWDHAGGNNKLLSKLSGLPCYGGSDKVQGLNHILKGDDVVELGSLKIRALSTTGHTMDHLCYYVEEKDDRAVFTGDW
jgi:hydroxyacylglutathione hydrolase